MRCPECGCADLRVSRWVLRTDARGTPYARALPAVQCCDCGRLYPEERALHEALQLQNKATWRRVRPDG